MALADSLLAVALALRNQAEPETKASAAGGLITAYSAGQPVWTPRRYDRLADEAFAQNVISFFCISLIAETFAHLPLMVFVGEDEQPDHPLAKLLRKPNPIQGGMRFRHALAAFHKLSGNSYIEAVRPRRNGEPGELWIQRPDRMKVIPGTDGLPVAYRYEYAGGKQDWPISPITGYGDLLHIKDFHPLNDWYGMGAVEPTANAIDLDNAGMDLNAALLQNGANPTTVFAFKGQLAADQIERAEDRLRQKYAGVDKNGSPVVLGGDWSVSRISSTMQEMQWTEGMRESARRICTGHRVPHVLAIPGESTYANREQGNLELHELCVLPFAEVLLEDTNPWFGFLFQQDGLSLRIDRDRISALEPRRESKRKSVLEVWEAKLITFNEARLELDYEERDDGDRFFGDLTPAQQEAQDTQFEREQALAQAQPQPTAAPGKPPVAQPGQRPRLAVVAGGKKSEDDEPDIDPDDLVDDEELASELTPYIRDVLRDFGQGVYQRLGLDVSFDVYDPKVADYLREFGGERITGLVGQTTRDAIGKALGRLVETGPTFDAQVNAIRQVFQEASATRARVIALTESTRAAGYGTQVAIERAGIERKSWLTSMDGRERPTHAAMNGQIQKAEDDFVSPSGSKGLGPGLMDRAAECVNCRCVMIELPDIDDVQAKAEPDDQRWKPFGDKLSHHESILAEACRRAFGAQERRAIVRLQSIVQARGAA